jgi:glutathionylspermidine synthase
VCQEQVLLVLVEVAQLVHLVDKLLLPAKQPSSAWMAGEGLKFLTTGENSDYFAEELVLFSAFSAQKLQDVALEGYKILLDAAYHVDKNNLWKEVGIPQNAIELVKHSLHHELNTHLIGRFDFSGGIDSDTVKILEFNADTFSLLAETCWVQPHILQQSGRDFRPIVNQTEQLLTAHFKRILAAHPNKEPNLLLSWMGYEEDLLNLEVVAKAARNAGFKQAQHMLLERIVFSPDEGIFVELGRDNFRQYDFFFKMVPWDFIAYDEPELMNILTDLVLNDLAVVINPACSMLLQSKGLLKIAHQMHPNHPNFLKTTNKAADFPDNRYVEKPVFGRVGDNVRIFTGKNKPEQENDGDYGHLPKVYQELATLEYDGEEYYYQPSIYWVGGDAAGICVRRQEDLIIDDDAEFIASGTMV